MHNVVQLERLSDLDYGQHTFVSDAQWCMWEGLTPQPRLTSPCAGTEA